MSKHKAFVPGVYIVGSQPKAGPDPEFKGGPAENAPIVHLKGFRAPLQTGSGRPVGHRSLRPEPLFEGSRVVGIQQHFINEAAKRECGGDIRKASPSQIVIVPLLKGLNSRHANKMRAVARRQASRATFSRGLDEASFAASSGVQLSFGDPGSKNYNSIMGAS